MGRNHLAYRAGDTANAILAAVAATSDGSSPGSVFSCAYSWNASAQPRPPAKRRMNHDADMTVPIDRISLGIGMHAIILLGAPLWDQGPMVCRADFTYLLLAEAPSAMQ